LIPGLFINLSSAAQTVQWQKVRLLKMGKWDVQRTCCGLYVYLVYSYNNSSAVLKGAKGNYVNLKHDTQNSEPRMEPGVSRIKDRSATI
jgi:hypothetical protein